MENNEVEIWKDVPGFIGLYKVSNLGMVKSMDRIVFDSKRKHNRRLKGAIIKSRKTRGGYLAMNLYRNGWSFQLKLHRMVMLAFKGPNELHVDHLNGIVTDNRLCNLEYVTSRENNIRHRNKTETELPVGVHRTRNRTYVAIICIKAKNYNLGSFNTSSEAAKAYNKAANDLDNIEKYVKRKPNRGLLTGIEFLEGNKKYRARIRVNGENKELGYFSNLDDAKSAYDKGKEERESLYKMQK